MRIIIGNIVSETPIEGLEITSSHDVRIIKEVYMLDHSGISVSKLLPHMM